MMHYLARSIQLLILLCALAGLVSCATSGDEAGSDNQASLDAEELKEIADKQKKVGSSHSQIARLYKAKRYREFQAEVAKILSRDEYDVRALAIMGIYHLNQNQLGAARIFFEKALKRHPEEAGLYNNLGVVAMKEGNLPSAMSNFKEALSIESNNPFAQTNLSSIYIQYMDYLEAEPLVEEAYSRLSGNEAAALNYAVILRTQKQYQEAEKIYQSVLAKSPRNIPTHLNYAILLVDYMKNYTKAKQLINKLEFLNSNSSYVQSKVRELQRKVSAAR